MRFVPRKNRKPPTVIVVALIDVLMVVLIFMVVSTTFKNQAAVRLALPESSQAKKEQGFSVLGFPCNQFGEQEKGGSDEISQFCELNFGVTFPLFEKIDVNGENAAPLFNYLTTNARGILGSKRIKWNFTKFLVGKDGKVVKRYAPTTKPEAIESDIQKLLSA